MWRWCLSTVRVAGSRARSLPSSAPFLSRAYSSLKLDRYTEDNKSDKSSRPHVTSFQADLSSLEYNTDVEFVSGRSRSGDRKGGSSRIVLCPTCAAPLDLASMPMLGEGVGSSHIVHPLSQETNVVDASTPSNILTTSTEVVGHHDSRTLGSSDADSSLSGNVEGISPPSDGKPADLSAVQLHHLLSPPKTSSIAPARHYLSYIRRLYFSAKAQDQLPLLSSADLSALIGLFGSLSLSTPEKPYRSVYAHPLAGHVIGSGRPHWGLVKQVAGLKRASGQPLNPSDRFWVMRAYLAELPSSDGEDAMSSCSLSVERALCLAGQHYRKIYLVQPHFDVHVPYLHALLSFPTSERILELVSCLCDLLTQHKRFHPRLLALLWQVVLRSDHELPSTLKERTLLVLWHRLQGEPLGCGVNRASRSDSRVDHARDVHIHELTTALNTAIFSDKKAYHFTDSLHRELSDWAVSVAQTVLSPDLRNGFSTDVRWSCLFLLALAQSAPGSMRGQSTPNLSKLSQNADVADWQVVCALASLERFFRTAERFASPPFHGEVTQGVSRVLDTLWRDWSTVRSDSSHPPVVARAICASFLNLAGRLENRTLRSACQEYSVRSGLWRVKDSEPTTWLGIRALAQEHLTCSLACGVWMNPALNLVLEYVGDPQLVSTIVSACVSRYSHIDVEKAQELQTVAQSAGIDVTAETLTVLAVNMAKQGFGVLALDIFADIHLSSQQQLRVLRPMLSILVRHGIQSLPRQFISGVGGAMSALFSHSVPPKGLRQRVESALLVLLNSGNLSQAVTILRGIIRSDRSFFTIAFLSTFLRTLLHRRQFHLAKRVFDLSITLYPDHRLASLRMLVVRYAQGGATTIASHMAMRHSGRSLGVSLARAVGFQRLPSSKGSTLKIPSLITRASGHKSPRAQYALHLLSLPGRLRKAKQMYGEMREHQPSRAQTVMGNMIVHASLLHRKRRNARRMRKVLDTMAELTAKVDFVPDRVTVNILLKALMHWGNEVDSGKLRALFDRLVLNGYPCGRGFDVHGVLPFGTGAGPAPEGFEMSKLNTGELSFRRHVRPLYRMFIKSFYLRDDVAAARTVVGILKTVQAEAMEAKKTRERTRITGRRMAMRLRGSVGEPG